MTETQQEEQRAGSLAARVGHGAAFVLTFCALSWNNVTIATNDHTPILIGVVAASALATILVAISWTRLFVTAKAISAGLVLLNLWTLLDAGGRRLPASLGW